jgi:hypothetical protein
VIANTRGSSFLQPDTLIIHPSNCSQVACSAMGRAAQPASTSAAARSAAPTATAAHRWLERRTVDATGDTCWFWTEEAEAALDLNALRRTEPADLN